MKPKKEFVNIRGVVEARLHGRFTIKQLDEIKKEIYAEQELADKEALGNSVDFIMQLSTKQKEYVLGVWNSSYIKVTLATLPFVSLFLLVKAFYDADDDDDDDEDGCPPYILKTHKLLDKVLKQKLNSLKKEGWKTIVKF